MVLGSVVLLRGLLLCSGFGAGRLAGREFLPSTFSPGCSLMHREPQGIPVLRRKGHIDAVHMLRSIVSPSLGLKAKFKVWARGAFA